MDYCNSHVELFGKLQSIEATIKAMDLRINGTMDTFKDHVEQGKTWRALIVGVCVTLVLQLVSFSFLYGRLTQMVETDHKVVKQMGGKI